LRFMRQATLCYLVRDGQICLGLKKRGFGINRWNGFGGKVRGKETIETAALRELLEESGVKGTELKKVAQLDFFFPNVDKALSWDQTVHVYLISNWEGTPSEGEEMRPSWFDFASIPYEQAWPDDIHWLPKVLAGSLIKGRFSFGEGDKILEKEVNIVEQL